MKIRGRFCAGLCQFAALWAAFAMFGCSSALVPSAPALDAGGDATGDLPRAEDAVFDVRPGDPPIAVCPLPDGRSCTEGNTCPAGDGCNDCTCSRGALQCTARPCAFDGGSVDAPLDGPPDAALVCPLPASSAACEGDGDCVTFVRRCYCGAEPIEGVHRRFLSDAVACEARAGASCALGCAVFPGQQAQDGRMLPDGGTASVRCEPHEGARACRTYVP